MHKKLMEMKTNKTKQQNCKIASAAGQAGLTARPSLRIF